MAQVIYARVPDAVKEDADEYADKQGLTLTSAVVDLIQRGLDAVTNERSIANLENRLAKAAVEQAETHAKLTVAHNELAALRAFAARAVQTKVGTCPERTCGAAISGYDLLGTGRCPKCEHSLLDLLAPPRTSSLDQRQFALLVGALSVAVGGALLGSAASR